MYADDLGYRTIARTLDGETTSEYQVLLVRYLGEKPPPSPSAGLRGTGSWSTSTIKPMLERERYIGQIPWGEFGNTSGDGRATQRVKQSQFLHADRPDLRIIQHDLWERVQKRLRQSKARYLKSTGGHPHVRPPSERESRYLLSGLLKCECCGSNIVVLGGRKGAPGKRENLFYYGCSFHWNRGSKVCSNDHKARMDQLDETVVDAIRRQVLKSDTIDYVIKRAQQILIERMNQQSSDRPDQLWRELFDVQRQLGNFIQLIADGGAPASVLSALRSCC